jgi:hypothetical protein
VIKLALSIAVAGLLWSFWLKRAGKPGAPTLMLASSLLVVALSCLHFWQRIVGQSFGHEDTVARYENLGFVLGEAVRAANPDARVVVLGGPEGAPVECREEEEGLVKGFARGFGAKNRDMEWVRPVPGPEAQARIAQIKRDIPVFANMSNDAHPALVEQWYKARDMAALMAKVSGRCDYVLHAAPLPMDFSPSSRLERQPPLLAVSLDEPALERLVQARLVFIGAALRQSAEDSDSPDRLQRSNCPYRVMQARPW